MRLHRQQHLALCGVPAATRSRTISREVSCAAADRSRRTAVPASIVVRMSRRCIGCFWKMGVIATDALSS
jgi:hypothetical protein